MSPSSGDIPDTVHIIPLGHEIDRAVQPFTKKKADRVYLLAIPPESDHDVVMREKQQHYTSEVIRRLKDLQIEVISQPVEMFEILEVMRIISRLIVREKEQGNQVFVNMSACGRKTSFAVTIAAMVHGVMAYYVPADAYATGALAHEESTHGISIVKTGKTEMLQSFQIMMPKHDSLLLLAELFRRDLQGKGEMNTEDIFSYLKQKGVPGFEKIPSGVGRDKKPQLSRKLLNRINSSCLKELEYQEYISREKRGRQYYFTITDAGKYIACVSGLVE